MGLKRWTGSGYADVNLAKYGASTVPKNAYVWDGVAYVRIWPSNDAFPYTLPFTFPLGGTSPVSHPYLSDADWLWEPIPASPVLDVNSATWAGYLSTGDHAASLYEYAVTVVLPSEVSGGTPRYTIPMSMVPAWGPHPFGSDTVPIPNGTIAPPMTTSWGDPGDAHLVVADPINEKIYGVWQAVNSGGAWSGSFGGSTSLQGNGQDLTGSSTGSGLSRIAGIVGVDEMAAAASANTGLGHTLFFSSDVAGPAFRFPAAKSDGENWRGVATPVPEGTRFQLDPSVNVDAISGITLGEKVIAKTLQTHGAVVGDQGGASAGFIFEMAPDANTQWAGYPGAVYESVGLGWDYYNMDKIPWGSLRALRQWDGA